MTVRRLRTLLLRARRSLRVRSVVLTLVLAAIAVTAVHGYIAYRISAQLYDAAVRTSVAASTRAAEQTQSTLSSTTAQTPAGIQALLNSSLGSVEASTGSQWVALLHTPQSDTTAITQDVLSSELESSSAVPAALRREVQRHPNDLVWKPTSLPESDSPAIVVGTNLNVPLAGPHELYIFYDLSAQADTLAFARAMLLLAAGVLLVLVGAITWVVVGLVLRPVRQTAAVSQQIAAGDLDRRLAVTGADEIVTLVGSFNTMADSLQARITELRRLSELQRRFVSDVSHELRTPLTTISLAESVLYDKRRSLGPEKRRSVELLHDEVERFNRLLADLLEMSRFDAGAQLADIAPVDLMGCVRAVLDSQRSVAERMGCELRLRGPAALVVPTDQRRVGRILRNFLTNALEHGQGHPVEVGVQRVGRRARMVVRDHGHGLTAEQIPHVFERFWRGDTSRQRTLGGTGLGLSIAAEDARLLRGRLEVWSEPGAGAAFALEIPLGADDSAVSPFILERPRGIGRKFALDGPPGAAGGSADSRSAEDVEGRTR